MQVVIMAKDKQEKTRLEYLLFHEQFSTERGVRVIDRLKFSGQKYPTVNNQEEGREAIRDGKHHAVWGLGMSHMVNIRESLFKASSGGKG